MHDATLVFIPFACSQFPDAQVNNCGNLLIRVRHLLHCAFATERRASLPLTSADSDVERVVAELRAAVHAETRLTVSAGIACNRLLAKIASDRNKPNGQCLVPASRDAIVNFLAPLPIRKIPGIGKVSERILLDLGIDTCQHLWDRRALLKLVRSRGCGIATGGKKVKGSH